MAARLMFVFFYYGVASCCSLTQYGANKPHQAVELIREAHLQKHGSHISCFHGVAELNTKQDAAIEEQLLEGAPGGKLTEIQLVQRAGGVGGRRR